MNTYEQVRGNLANSMRLITQYQGSPLLIVVADLLDALAQEAMYGLSTVQPDKLQYKQGALAQLNLLRNALRSPSPVAPLRA